jgi:SOS-response transcriptional repressor LexA
MNLQLFRVPDDSLVAKGINQGDWLIIENGKAVAVVRGTDKKS